MILAEIVVIVVEIYLVVGVLFGIAFVTRGVAHAPGKPFASAGWCVITCSRQAFPEDCPWEDGPEDHLQMDLSDVDNLADGVAELRARLDGGPLHPSNLPKRFDSLVRASALPRLRFP